MLSIIYIEPTIGTIDFDPILTDIFKYIVIWGFFLLYLLHPFERRIRELAETGHLIKSKKEGHAVFFAVEVKEAVKE